MFSFFSHLFLAFCAFVFILLFSFYTFQTFSAFLPLFYSRFTFFYSLFSSPYNCPFSSLLFAFYLSHFPPVLLYFSSFLLPPFSSQVSPLFLPRPPSVLHAACLQVSPDRSQFFRYNSISLSCEDQLNSTGWKVKRKTSESGVRSCSSGWGSISSGSTCVIGNTYPSDTGVYWCESARGEQSNAVNITITGTAHNTGNKCLL